MTQPDFRKYYDLERYLFDDVSRRFAADGTITAFDFFCIIIWKAERSKSRVATRFHKQGFQDLSCAIAQLTTEIRAAPSHKEKLRTLIKDWGFRLPTASSILTVLYPDDFTVYDIRVCGLLPGFEKLGSTLNFEKQWAGYQKYIQAVKSAVPADWSLRDKDRALWGKSFAKQLEKDIIECFRKPTKN